MNDFKITNLEIDDFLHVFDQVADEHMKRLMIDLFSYMPRKFYLTFTADILIFNQ